MDHGFAVCSTVAAWETNSKNFRLWAQYFGPYNWNSGPAPEVAAIFVAEVRTTKSCWMLLLPQNYVGQML